MGAAETAYRRPSFQSRRQSIRQPGTGIHARRTERQTTHRSEGLPPGWQNNERLAVNELKAAGDKLAAIDADGSLASKDKFLATIGKAEPLSFDKAQSLGAMLTTTCSIEESRMKKRTKLVIIGVFLAIDVLKVVLAIGLTAIVFDAIGAIGMGGFVAVVPIDWLFALVWGLHV